MDLIAIGIDAGVLAILIGIFYRLGGLVSAVDSLKHSVRDLRGRVTALEVTHRKEGAT